MTARKEDMMDAWSPTAPDAPRAWPEWMGRRVLVVGLARSGAAAARLLAERGIAVTGTDPQPAESLPLARSLAARGVHLALGTSDAGVLDGHDLVVVSPGVPPEAAVIARADREGIPVVSELELAFQVSRAPWVAITGTNGKSTTTALTGEIFRAAGRTAWVGGNIGIALTERVATLPADAVVVAEVSSFQLERVVTFRPRVATILNLTPDHLDRYASVGQYEAAKARVFACQTAADFAVVNADDPAVADWPERFALHGRVLRTSLSRPVAEGAYVDEDERVVRVWEGHREVLLPARSIRIAGPHNWGNALAAACSALPLGVKGRHIAEALRNFKGLEHRIEPVGVVRGVAFYNDSKATNVESMCTALKTFPYPVVVIAGGRDKAGDWVALRGLARERIGRLVLIGEATDTIQRAWPEVPSTRAATLEEAVRDGHAAALALGGAPVVLSPGCASFDMFRDYEDRGRRFKAAVQDLARESGR